MLLAQFVFVATNTIAVVLGISYNTSTPDLYPNNAHHRVGWVATWVVTAQLLTSLVGRVAGVMRHETSQPHGKEEQQAFILVSTENMAEHQRLQEDVFLDGYRRHSNDSGQGTEPNTESLRSRSDSTLGQQSPHNKPDWRNESEDDDLDFKDVELQPRRSSDRSLVARVAGKISSRGWKTLLVTYNFIDRTILILGFITLTTGIATWGHFFVSTDLSFFSVRGN